MSEQAVTGIIPNLGGQEAAVAGSQAVVFTATDRQLIEERGGKIDKTRSFLDVLKERPMTPEVENEETNVRPQMDLSEFKGRIKEHKRMLKHSNLYNPRERVEIKKDLPDKYEEDAPPPQPRQPATATNPEIEVKAEAEAPTEAKAKTQVVIEEKEQNNSRLDAYDQMNQEQTNLNAVKSRAKQYHLLRLLTDNEQEFRHLSDKIRMESLSATKPAGRKWLDAQLTKITLGAAKYKLNLLNSLEEMHLDDQHKKTITWLTRTIESLSQK